MRNYRAAAVEFEPTHHHAYAARERLLTFLGGHKRSRYEMVGKKVRLTVEMGDDDTPIDPHPIMQSTSITAAVRCSHCDFTVDPVKIAHDQFENHECKTPENLTLTKKDVKRWQP